MPKEPKERNKKVTNAKNKGREFTKRIRQILIETFDLDPEQIRVSVGYEGGIDIKLTGEAKKRVCLGIECKNQAQISLGPWLKQAVVNAKKEGLPPALFYHKPVQGNDQVWITLRLEDYLEIRTKLMQAEDQISWHERMVEK